MNIVYFGSPAVSLIPLKALHSAGHCIKLIVTQPDKPSGRGKKIADNPLKLFALEKNIPLFQSKRIRKDPLILKELELAQPDINIVVAYGQIMPDSIIYYPPHNSLNIHFSLLPKYRGASPVQWALLNGEQKTGITIFELDPKMDEGDILDQKEISIKKGELAKDLEFRLSKLGASALLEILKDINSFPLKKQDHSQATYTPIIQKENGRIDWNKDAASLENQIRAFHYWPSSFCFFKEKRIKVIKGFKIPAQNKNSEPGKVISITKSGLDIRCGCNSLFRIEVLQPENKKSMEAYSFSLGARIKAGDKFF